MAPRRFSKKAADPQKSAKAVGLHYVSDTSPGIRRQRVAEEFIYLGPDGQRIEDPQTLQRIKSLVIPPAWQDVWICPKEDGHLQATGRDAKGRKQYRYHPLWHQVRNDTKYSRMMAFGRALPLIRKRVEEDLAGPDLSRHKVLATVVRLLEATLIRVGNEEYAKANDSYGLTTMRDHHVNISGCTVNFQFRGKSGKFHSIELDDCHLAHIVQKCQELPGQELFQYLDEQGQTRTIGSEDVNAYLREISGQDYTAKDFRTWAATVLAAMALQEMKGFSTKTQGKKNVVRAIESVAQQLGNTPSICRKCYVHPAIIDTYMDGLLLDSLKRRVRRKLDQKQPQLRPEEAAVLRLLEARLKRAKPEQKVRKSRPRVYA